MSRTTRRNRPIKPISVYIDADLWRRVNGYSKSSGVSKTFIVEKAIAGYMDEIEARAAVYDVRG